MGQITIQMNGSFGTRSKTFSALEGGHANAIAHAIRYLSGQILPAAIELDHKLHDKGVRPPNADFGRGDYDELTELNR